METELEHLFGLLMFLGHEPFCDRRVWADYIVRPIRKGVAAAEQRLLDILSQVMIKNKQEDIDKEIALPECHTSVVQLKLNDSERQKYNEIVSQIKTNLIASRGSGPDSFLHPANRNLDVASEQLHDPKLRGELSEPEVADLQSVVEIMIAGDHTLEAHLLVSPRDASLDLHNDAAAPGPPSSSPPPGPPREEQPADLGRQGSAPAPPPTAGPSLEVLRQLRLQRFSPSDTPSTPVSPPIAIASAAAAALVCEEVMEDSLPAMETAPAPAPAPTDPPPTPSVDRDPSTVPVSSPPSFSFSDSFARPLPLLSPTTPTAPVQPTTSSAPACEEAAAPVHPGGVVAASPTAAASSSAAASAGATSLLLKSALPEAAYIPLSEVNSTKLTYLLDRLQQLPEGSKAIIFSQFVHVLLILRQALRHVGLPFCEFFYGSHSSPAARASALTTFNTSDYVRVILMKTELAAFGINLTAASHVFFVDQVWDPSVERQAIKRAHRIGQTKEVFVEKLVMENTIEATILTFNQDKSLAPQTEATKGESELKAQRKVHSLLRSLEFIHRLGGDGAEAEDEDGDPGVILGKRARQLFGRAGDARDDPRSKGKEKSDDVEDEGEQAIASIDLRREKKRKKTVKRVRFMEPDESETVTEEGAASSTSTTSSSSSAREPSTDDVVRKRSRDGAEEGRALLLQGSVGPDDDVSDSIQAAAHGTPPKRVRFLDDDSSSSAEQGE
ncbi:helicase C-terminal domain containing protein, putative [Acanthamoeba castellanii str. Neff]|uniref:Helicase C-terminal domain containing protein, putative n=1 Tax=Acanthamoeba castellanii (strain ATCC 30010 / Neff) TaxID=1257118 RepID=L8H6T8_ACACF|nr:helicase C-terminal domain containing protein, putative [Acanthamoeba castellanii str. Neff]ELR20957.1 helicase C-terminal domain containing protein, putative [Acanthamoeba castellanii str. Neff]